MQSHYEVVISTGDLLQIRDIGTDESTICVLDDAGRVVAELADSLGSRRLEVVRGDGFVEEVLVRNGVFSGSCPVPVNTHEFEQRRALLSRLTEVTLKGPDRRTINAITDSGGVIGVRWFDAGQGFATVHVNSTTINEATYATSADWLFAGEGDELPRLVIRGSSSDDDLLVVEEDTIKPGGVKPLYLRSSRLVPRRFRRQAAGSLKCRA